jgi:hypothetical protein
MKLNIPALLATVLCARTVAADSFHIVTKCDNFHCNSQGTWKSGFGYSGHFDANDRCHSTGPSGMSLFCMDWSNARGHFYLNGQGKRCMADAYTTEVHAGTWLANWEEVACTW